jgi:hypothetical protein
MSRKMEWLKSAKFCDSQKGIWPMRATIVPSNGSVPILWQKLSHCTRKLKRTIAVFNEIKKLLPVAKKLAI